jgi:uncharacterized membrane protein
MKKKISLYIMAAFYLLAGFNHFRSPEFYYSLIPLGNVVLLNALSGIAEIGLAVLLLFTITRKWASYGIALMLLAFIPSHIYMLQQGFCINSNCAPEWALWARLLVLQPILIWWALSLRNTK